MKKDKCHRALLSFDSVKIDHKKQFKIFLTYVDDCVFSSRGIVSVINIGGAFSDKKIDI